LLDDTYGEIDVKIKDHLGQDSDLGKGVFNIRGLAARSLTGSMVETIKPNHLLPGSVLWM
jgi:hypothetical protein